jgi:hypothetical protein
MLDIAAANPEVVADAATSPTISGRVAGDLRLWPPYVRRRLAALIGHVWPRFVLKAPNNPITSGKYHD